MYRQVGVAAEGLAPTFSPGVLCESVAMVLVLDDGDVSELLTPDRAVGWMREALLAAHQGRLVAPPRVHTDLGDGRLVFTTGTAVGDWFGYRSYDSFDVEPGEQVVVVHDARDGRVRGLAIGNALGPRRVGAIGAVAADVLAGPDADTLALVGTGQQAWTQLWAIVRPRRHRLACPDQGLRPAVRPARNTAGRAADLSGSRSRRERARTDVARGAGTVLLGRAGRHRGLPPQPAARAAGLTVSR